MSDAEKILIAVRSLAALAMAGGFFVVSYYDAWGRRVIQAGVSHVISLLSWSLEFKAMGSHPELFSKLAGGDQNWGVYRVEQAAKKR